MWYYAMVMRKITEDMYPEQAFQAYQSHISRQEFIVKSTKAAITGAIGGGVIGTAGLVAENEITKGLEGVRTGNGTFIPLYERHDRGIDTRDIPHDTDVYFREVTKTDPTTGQQTLMDEKAGDILNGLRDAYVGTPLETHDIRVFPREVLDTLSDIEAEIMVGDISVGRYYTVDTLRALTITYCSAGGFAALLSFLSARHMNSADISRRKFLQLAGWAMFLWGSPQIYGKAIAYIVPGMDSKQNAEKRIVARILGMSSDFHPENTGEFFRNVVMADKMLHVASNTESVKGNNPLHLAFQVEAMHSGIEDFLQLGPDACRAVILAHPKEFIREVVDMNGGIEKFCTSRIFRLPKGAHTLNENMTDVIDGYSTERKIVDTKLKQSLEKKLST